MRVLLSLTLGVSLQILGASPAPELAGGTCTGFFVDQTHVITCAHCVPPNGALEVVHGSTKAEAQVEFVDTNLDIAALTCAMLNVKALKLGNSDSLRLLDDLYVFGFPLASTLGVELSASQGKLNARRSAFGKNWLQLDAVINPGNSGGPIVNKEGELVGIAVAKLAPLALNQSLRLVPERVNFAIPSSALRNRLIQAHIPFSVTKPENPEHEDVFATAKDATVLLLISPKKSAAVATPAPSKQTPRTAENIMVKATMMTEPHGREVTAYTADAPKLYAIFKTEGVIKGDKIRAVWIADDVGEAAPAGTKIDEKTLTMEGDTEDGVFSLSQPTKGWPLGKYHLEIFVNGDLATKVNFAIKAASKSKKHAGENEEE